ncbi:hypothetical protein EN803_34825 [Mesorhizobium sp. M2D.F.Ca.ET.160.01.1.1]|nr:hypothetical protein EN803_34825 [Mesorhizobium sp. M2D.F.Ca.ET.160.01.1.1]
MTKIDIEGLDTGVGNVGLALWELTKDEPVVFLSYNHAKRDWLIDCRPRMDRRHISISRKRGFGSAFLLSALLSQEKTRRNEPAG